MQQTQASLNKKLILFNFCIQERIELDIPMYKMDYTFCFRFLEDLLN